MSLKDVIDAEPGNAGRTDQEILDWVLEDVAVLGPITTKRMWGWAVTDDLGGAFQARRDNIGENKTVRGLCRGMLAIMNGPQDFDVGDPAAQTNLAAAVSLGVITQPQRDALEALATTQIPRWRSAGLRKAPALIDITRARAA